MTITRALYQKETHKGNKTNFETFLATEAGQNSGLSVDDMTMYKDDQETIYSGIVLLSQYKLAYSREYRHQVNEIWMQIDEVWS